MIDAKTRQLVRRRAGERCEYCRLPEDVSDVPFHVEHVVAKQHLADDAPTNLALACDRCNVHKGPNLSSIDPQTGTAVALFHPRRDRWAAHFAFRGPAVVGLTPTGRATVRLLHMNTPRRVQVRRELLRRGETL
ncbi:MAG: HNH endonuclease [Planctomycetota bacterium]|nr:HNH endonuclease [Planctomycetota bacterium]